MTSPMVAAIARSSYFCRACGQNSPPVLHRDGRDVVAERDRLRVQGWRIWTGTTLGGEEQTAVYCPSCCGEGGVSEDGEPAGWWAECETCGSDMEEWGDEPYTEADCKEWKRDHECEPEVHIMPPKRAGVSP